MTLVSRLSGNERIKRIIFWLVAFFSVVYCFSIPTFGESSSFTRYVIYVSMFFVAFFSIIYCYLYLNFSFKKETLLIPLFTIFALIGTVFWSKDIRGWLSLFLLAISFFVFICAFRILREGYIILSIISIGFFLFSLYFIFYFRNEILHFNSETRLGPPFDNQNGVSAYAVIGFSISLHILLFSKKRYKFLFIAPIITSLIVGVSTGSRTFILSIPIFLFIFLFFRFKKHKKIFLISTAGVLAISIIFMSLPFMESFRNRLIVSIQTIFGTADKVDTSTLTRAVYIDYGFYLGGKKLLFGYGVNGFSIFSGVGTYAHSNYSEVLCDFGFIGFVLFYLPLVILFIHSLKNKRIDKPLILSFFVYYLIVSFTNVLYYKKVYYLVLALLYYFVFFDPRLFETKALCNKLNNIVITCDTMGSGGAEKVIASLSNEMADFGILVTIIGVADIKKPSSFFELSEGVKYINLSNRDNKKVCSIKRVFKLRKIIKGIKPDIVISFLPNANIYTCLSLYGTNIPYIVSERNNPYTDPNGKVMRLLKRYSFNHSYGAVFQTTQAKEFYSTRVQEKAIIIKNPISLTSTPSFLKSRNKTVLSVGRLVEQKNHKCLFDAFNIFNKKHNMEYQLKIYGDGPLKTNLELYCSQIGISDYVSFVGSDNEWHKKEADVSMFVLSSNYEGMPNALAEAMALGIPCISTDCPTGGPKELITDSENGFLVEINNANALAEKMSQIIDPNIANRFSSKNTNMVEDYCPRRIAKQWLNYILSLTIVEYEQNPSYR